MKNEIKKEIAKLLPQIKNVLEMINNAEDDWPNHFDRNDPEDMYLRSMYYRIAENLSGARRLAQQIEFEVIEEGYLYKNSAGRYEVSEGNYFTSNEPIEYLQKDEEFGDRWVYSRIEHNGEDYYITAEPDMKLEGVKVRIKKVPFLER